MKKENIKAGLTERAEDEMRAALLEIVAELPAYEMHLVYIFARRFARDLENKK